MENNYQKGVDLMNMALPGSQFDIRAKQILKPFIRKVSKFGFNVPRYFLTGTKKRNNIVGVTKEKLVIKTDASKEKFSISIQKIEQAISFILYKRIVNRKELEKYSNYNSALMGLLEMILFEVARIQKSVKGVLQIRLIGVRFFFSGMDRCSEADFQTIVHNGGTFILCSYFYLREKGKSLEAFMNKLKDNGLKMILDSGAFSIHNALEKGKTLVSAARYNSLTAKQRAEMNVVKEITVNDFATVVNEYSDMIYGYFNLDVIGDAKASAYNFNQLKQLTGKSPIPVWHCDVINWRESDFELLNEMVNEDYEIIALGATVPLGKNAGPQRQNKVKEKLFEEIFKRHPEQCFHWLGGSSDLLLKFPFFSADSSGWIQGRKTNQIYSFEEQSTEKMNDWSKERCLAYNVFALSSLEYIGEGIQGSLLFNEFEPKKTRELDNSVQQLEFAI